MWFIQPSMVTNSYENCYISAKSSFQNKLFCVSSHHLSLIINIHIHNAISKMGLDHTILIRESQAGP